MLLPALITLYLLSPTSAQRRPYAQPQLQPQPQPQPQFQQQGQPASDILTQISDVNPDGSFYTKYETANGISYEEQGQLASTGQAETAERVQGSASWTDNEGQKIGLSWQADENGAVFQGDHLPTPPPIPELILRALEWIAANPGKGDEDGQYREEEATGNRLGSRPQAGPLPVLSRRPPPRG